MALNNFIYVILNTTEITDENSTIDFSKLLNVDANSLRYSVDGTKAIIKYDGNQPSFLNGKTTYSHSEILTEIAKTDWSAEVTE